MKITTIRIYPSFGYGSYKVEIQTPYWVKVLDDFIEAITEIAYICCYTANEKIGSYEEWLRGIPRINTNDDWIVEVTEFAVDCFC